MREHNEHARAQVYWAGETQPMGLMFDIPGLDPLSLITTSLTLENGGLLTSTSEDDCKV